MLGLIIEVLLNITSLRVFAASPLDQPHALDGLVAWSNAAHAQPPHPEAQATLIEVEALVRVDWIKHLELEIVTNHCKQMKCITRLLGLGHVGDVALAGEGGVYVVNVVPGVLLVPL